MVDLGWLILNIVFGVSTIGALIIGVFFLSDEWNREMGVPFILGAIFIGGGLLLWVNFPFNMAYHSYRPVSGTVASVNSRIVDTGNHSSETKYVITFKGSAQPYGCTDTRCAALKVGDHLSLMCERVWQYASVSGYDCNYNSVGV